LGDQGYSLAFFTYRHPEAEGENDVFHAVMKLDVGNYQDVEHLKDVDPLEVDAHIAKGWEITSTSISTKFIRMIRRRAPSEAPSELRQIGDIQDRESMHNTPEERILISPELRAQRGRGTA
jgi:hypothetical protein